MHPSQAMLWRWFVHLCSSEGSESMDQVRWRAVVGQSVTEIQLLRGTLEFVHVLVLLCCDIRLVLQLQTLDFSRVCWRWVWWLRWCWQERRHARRDLVPRALP
jgi:hypothetical protein